MLTTPMCPVPAISYVISYGGAQRPRPTMENEQFVQKLYTPVRARCLANEWRGTETPPYNGE